MSAYHTAALEPTIRLRRVAPTGDGRTIVLRPIFSHPFFGWEIVRVIESGS